MPRETTLRRMCNAAAEDVAKQIRLHAVRGASLDGLSLEQMLRAALQAARDSTSEAIFEQFYDPGDVIDGSGSMTPETAEALFASVIDAILNEKPDGEADAA